MVMVSTCSDPDVELFTAPTQQPEITVGPFGESSFAPAIPAIDHIMIMVNIGKIQFARFILTPPFNWN
jgi:hypothetical protein